MDYININVTDQITTFALSLGLGVVYCLFYDILRVFHKTWLKGFFEVLVADILFWAVLSVVTFCFLIIRCQGNVRAYVLVGQVFGFIIARFTVSRIFIKALSIIFTTIFDCFKRFSELIGKILIKCEKFLKKMRNKAKKLLQDKAVLLYNHLKVCAHGKCDNKSPEDKER